MSSVALAGVFRTNLPVEYSDWLELGLRNLSEEILWLSSLQVSLAPPHQHHSQRCGAVDLHQNERLQELPRFLLVTKLRSSVLGPGQSSLDTVWEIRVESEGPRPPPGCLGEERPDLASDLWQLFRQDVLTDYTLVCGGEEVRVHRAVLAARAEYWRGALTSGMREATGARAEVSQVTRQTLHLLLEFIYTGRIKVTWLYCALVQPGRRASWSPARWRPCWRPVTTGGWPASRSSARRGSYSASTPPT